jgi:hypothetical protein
VRVFIVCEGSTDFPVLRLVVRAVLPEPDLIVEFVQPDLDALKAKAVGAIAPGWTGVRTYLQSAASTLLARQVDVLIVHVDADVPRVAPQIARKLRDASSDEPDLAPLCDHVKSWFAGGVPESAIVVIPRDATEAWLLAVQTRAIDVESNLAPASTLRAKGLLASTARGDPNKERAVYAKLAAPLGDLIADRKQLARVPELERFVGKLRSRARALRRAKKAGQST